MSVNSRKNSAVIVCTANELSAKGNKIDITFPFGEMAHNIGVYARVKVQQKTKRVELVLGTDYYIKHSYDPEKGIYGIVEINLSSANFSISALKNICVYRKIENYQNLDFDVHMTYQGLAGSAVDKLTLMAQDEQLSRDYNIHAPYDDKAPNMELPPVEERKNKFVRFDDDGNVILNDILEGKYIKITEELGGIKIHYLCDHNDRQRIIEEIKSLLVSLEALPEKLQGTLRGENGIHIERKDGKVIISYNSKVQTFAATAFTGTNPEIASFTAATTTFADTNQEVSTFDTVTTTDEDATDIALQAGIAIINAILPKIASLKRGIEILNEGISGSELIAISNSVAEDASDVVPFLMENTEMMRLRMVKMDFSSIIDNPEIPLDIKEQLIELRDARLENEMVYSDLFIKDFTNNVSTRGNIKISQSPDGSIILSSPHIVPGEGIGVFRGLSGSNTEEDLIITTMFKEGDGVKFEKRIDEETQEEYIYINNALKAGKGVDIVGDRILANVDGETIGFVKPRPVDKLNINQTELKLSIARSKLASSVCGDYAIFAGGKYFVSPEVGISGSDSVDVYKIMDDAVTKVTDVSNLSIGRYGLAGAAIKDYVIFAGGNLGAIGDDSDSNAVDVYRLNNEGTGLEKVAIKDSIELSVARSNLAAATVGDYILFAGGNLGAIGDDSDSNAVDVYRLNNEGTGLEKVAIEDSIKLSVARSNLAAATVGDYILFAGGDNGDSTIDVFKINSDGGLTLSQTLNLSIGRGQLSATSMGGLRIIWRWSW